MNMSKNKMKMMKPYTQLYPVKVMQAAKAEKNRRGFVKLTEAIRQFLVLGIEASRKLEGQDSLIGWDEGMENGDEDDGESEETEEDE